MNKFIASRIVILSALLGAMLSVFCLLPVVVKLAFFLLMTCVSLPVLYLLKKYNVFKPNTVQDSILTGALCGFVSFLVFAIIYLPLVFLISLVLPITYLGGFVLMLKLSSFSLILMFTIFVAIVSALFNAFSSLLWYYVEGSLEVVKNTTDKQ